jgi:hypothetical protein
MKTQEKIIIGMFLFGLSPVLIPAAALWMAFRLISLAQIIVNAIPDSCDRDCLKAWSELLIVEPRPIVNPSYPIVIQEAEAPAAAPQIIATIEEKQEASAIVEPIVESVELSIPVINGESDKVKAMELMGVHKQWHEAKGRHPGVIVLMRIGDFYRTWGADAEKVKTAGGIQDGDSVWFHREDLETILKRLLASRHRVAIAEPIEKKEAIHGINVKGQTVVETPVPSRVVAVEPIVNPEQMPCPATQSTPAERSEPEAAEQPAVAEEAPEAKPEASKQKKARSSKPRNKRLDVQAIVKERESTIPLTWRAIGLCEKADTGFYRPINGKPEEGKVYFRAYPWHNGSMAADKSDSSFYRVRFTSETDPAAAGEAQSLKKTAIGTLLNRLSKDPQFKKFASTILETGWLTNGRYLVKLEGKELDKAKAFADANYDRSFPSKAIQVGKFIPKKNVESTAIAGMEKILDSEGEITCIVFKLESGKVLHADAKLVAEVLGRYPEATVSANHADKLLIFKSGCETIGMVATLA